MLQEHAAIIGAELNLTKRHVAAALKLFDDGATIPFVARYRKEATGSIDETTLRKILLRHEALTELDERKALVIKAAKDQGALTPELQQRIAETLDPAVLDDIYMPYKPRRKTRAAAAREAGLEPLANIIQAQNSYDIEKQARKFVSDAVATPEDAIDGALDIIAERVNESEKARGIVRARFMRSGNVVATVIAGKEEEGRNYQNYFNFTEPVRLCSSHRYLAIRRGEDEGILRVSIGIDDTEMIERLSRMFVRNTATGATAPLVRRAVADGYKRLLRPSIENEVAAMLKERSDDAAISLFTDNLTQMLMQAPLTRVRVMAIDPGFRSGCKIVCLDQQGNPVADDVIYPNAPANDFYGASQTVCYMVERYMIDVIAIGNGTAGRETERFISSLQMPRRVKICMVSEQGASVYSASEAAIEEFPDLDVTLRGAISIGRRLLDPLAELVKIEPQSIGVGQYQHDVNGPKLKRALDYTVSECVNNVGVNLNTASRQLLSYVSGIGPALARNIVEYRNQNGDFTSRQQLLEVPRMGVKAFQQSAGFLRIPEAVNVLDNTAIHPESYPLVERIAKDHGITIERLAHDKNLLHSIDLEPYVTRTTGLPTLTDIILELEKPGRDPRTPVDKPSEALPGVDTIEDLHIGQELTGSVNNITAFGVFVDLNIKENGLIHISQLSDDFIRQPSDVVSIGQTVRVRVIDIDVRRGRIALTMKGVPQK